MTFTRFHHGVFVWKLLAENRIELAGRYDDAPLP
jgi:hypothetical protein